MNKIINRHRYDTETATMLANWETDMSTRDFEWFRETLYRTKAGLYFLLGDGNAASKYARSCGQNEWCGGEKIVPIDADEARKWVEAHCNGDTYESIFGPVDDVPEPEYKNDALRVNVVLDNGAYMPERAHELDAGYDIRTPFGFVLYPHSTQTVDTGVHMELPAGSVGFLKSKSGHNVVYSIVNEGVIDAGFTGAITVKLYNHGNELFQFLKGDKITQLVILPILTPELNLVKELKETERGNSGFGSTGR